MSIPEDNTEVTWYSLELDISLSVVGYFCCFDFQHFQILHKINKINKIIGSDDYAVLNVGE